MTETINLNGYSVLFDISKCHGPGHGPYLYIFRVRDLVDLRFLS